MDTVTIAPGVEAECPACGAKATNQQTRAFQVQQDGTWRPLVRALMEPGARREDFARLARLLKNAQVHGQTTEEIARTVEADTPFAGLARWMLSDPGGNAATWLTLLLTVLSLLAPSGNTEVNVNVTNQPVVVVHEGPTEQEIEDRVRQVLADMADKENHRPAGDP